MGKKFILAGMSFGDEGKGTFVDYLTHKYGIKQIIRYNGGSQASHTVITPKQIVHKFSQMGSGMFLKDCKTYLSSNMVINPVNLIAEVIQFSKKTGLSQKEVLERIIIDEKCYIVTPYHSLMNKLRELSKGKERRGSVGTGVSEVNQLLREKTFWSNGLGVQMKDLYDTKSLYEKIEDLHYCVKNFYMDNEEIIEDIFLNADEIMGKELKSLDRQIEELFYKQNIEQLCNTYQSFITDKRFNICKDIGEVLQPNEDIIFEGSQGLLLDEVYGTKPNTTILDTTIKNALHIVEAMKVVKEEPDSSEVVKIGIAKAFASRHGAGVFPTEDASTSYSIRDNNQEKSFWMGQMRFGWFDAVLMRYAQSINNVDELYLSSVDKLRFIQTIKICNKYIYTGNVDEGFKTMFEYENKNDSIIVHNIRNNQGNISKYLMQCKPVYIGLNGFGEDMSEARCKDDLPVNCLNYIALIERLTGIRVSLISVGPTRDEKVEL